VKRNVLALACTALVSSLVSSLAACTPNPPAEQKADGKEAKATPEAKTDEKTDTKTETPKPRGKQIPAPADVAAAPADATKTASGLAYKELEPGTGDALPKVNDAVKIDVTGWTSDGTTFETTESGVARRGSLSVEVPIQSLVPGGDGVIPANVITVVHKPILGIQRVSNPVATAFARGASTDAATPRA